MIAIHTLKIYIVTHAVMGMLTAQAAAPAAEIYDPHNDLVSSQILLAECKKEPDAINKPLFDTTLGTITKNHFLESGAMNIVLHTAIRNGHDYCVQQLVKYGMPVGTAHYPWQRSTMPLHTAAQSGHCSIIRILLDAHADINARSAVNHTALEYSAQEDHPEAMKLLLTYDAPHEKSLFQHLLHIATMSSSVKVAQTLIDNYEVTVDALDEDNETALHHAIRTGSSALVELLLLRNADPKTNDQHQHSCLFIAIEHALKNRHTPCCMSMAITGACEKHTNLYQSMIDITALLVLHGTPPLTENEITRFNNTIGDPTDILGIEGGPVKNAQDQIDYANALLASHIARDNKNHLLNFLPHDVCGEIVEYALTPGVYREHEREKQARMTPAKPNLNNNDHKSECSDDKNSDYESESVDEKESEEPIAPEK